VLRPVSDYDPVPSDVEAFAQKLRQETPAPAADLVSPFFASPRFSHRYFDMAGAPRIGNEGEDEEAQESGSILGQRPGLVRQSEAPKLDHWTVRANVYTKEMAAKIGILAGLFGISGTRVSAGVVHEAKRYRKDTTDETTVVEVGVAVRLIAATTEWDVQADISIPNIAAAVNLNAKIGDARIGIEVTGYSGPLGDILPAPSKLDVSTLVDYVAAFNRIQRTVFGETGLPFLTPAVINWEDDPESSGSK
jgi:hypothetical protein